MRKSKLNFFIDAFMFLCMAMIAGIGFLMEYVILPGREILEKYGENIELSFLGLDRRQWGDIHLVVGFTLLGLLLLHIILHWKMIKGLYKKAIADQKSRKKTAIIYASVCLILVSFPFVIKPHKGDVISGYRHSISSKEVTNHRNEEHEKSITVDIKGYMTLS